MPSAIDVIIDCAVAGISRRHGARAAASSLVHALSQIRDLVDRQGGPAMRSILETNLRDQLLGERVRLWNRQTAPAASQSLPIIIDRDAQRRADAIMSDAVMTCLTFGGDGADGDADRPPPGGRTGAAAAVTVKALADRLCQTLHGAPEWDELMRAMGGRLKPSDGDPEAEAGFGFSQRSFRLH